MHFVNAKGILSAKNGMNIYRGCTHGCIYCDSRSECYQIGHDFEDIEVKANAIELLEDALRRRRTRTMIGTGAMCDPYLHLEQELEMTRKTLELVYKYGFGISLLTKSNRVLRDLDLLTAINNKTKCVVQMTLTTYDEDLCKILEPNVSTTFERFEALKTLRDNGIPTVVWLGPILPFINNTPQNITGLLDYCAQAGVYGIICFGMGLTLRNGNREYYYEKLDQHFPNLKQRYINTYGNSYEIAPENTRELWELCKRLCKKHGLVFNQKQMWEFLNEFEDKTEAEQLTLF